MLYNEDELGIHYTFGYGHHISGDALNDICQGDDLVYDEAISDLREEFEGVIEEFLDNNYLNDHNLNIDRMFDDNIIDIFNDSYQNDYQRFRYEQDGSIIEYDNNGNDLIIIKSPYYTFRGFGSPCIPNGCYIETEGDIKAYCLPIDWFDEYSEIPYKEYYKVENDEKILVGDQS